MGANQGAIVAELYRRIDTLPPEKQAIVQELANRFGVGPNAGAQMRATALDRAREEMDYVGDDTGPARGFHLSDVFGAINPVRIAQDYVNHMNHPYETASGMPGGGSIAELVPVTPAIQATEQVMNRDYGGAVGTIGGTAVGIAAPIGLAKGLGAVARRLPSVPTPSGALEPQLDPAEARSVQFADDTSGGAPAVKLPASVRSGSEVAKYGEKILQHFPGSSKIAKTARAAEQSTLAERGAYEVAGLGSPDAAGPVPSALDVGEAVHAKVDQLQADHAAAGSKVSGSAPQFLDAGESLNKASQANVEAHGKTADDSYNLLRSIEAQPQFKAKLQTGTRRVDTGMVDETGAPVYKTEPVIEDIQLPVDRRPAKAAIKPLLGRMLRLMPLAQEQASAGIKALRNLVDGPDFESASVTDEDLGAIKRVIREATDDRTRGLAQEAVDALSKQVDAAVQRAGPEAVAALKKGREATVNKYKAIDFQTDLGFQNAGNYGAAPGEPVGLANGILRPGDRSINLLRKVAEHTPEQVPVLGDALAHDLVTQVRQGDAGGALDRWKSYGEATKKILYPEAEAPAGGGAAPPSKAAAIGSYLERAAELEGVKKSLPASDALVKNIIGGGVKGTNLLQTVSEHAPEHIPALGQRVVQDLIEKGTAEAGMGRPQSVLTEWNKIGAEKKNILYRDPYPFTGEGAPRAQRLTDFFTLMKRLGENPNPSGSGTVMAFIKGVGLVVLHPLTGIPVLLGAKAASRMLFNPETSRWMMQALKMPATAKGAPLLAKQVINAAGPDVDTVAPEASAPVSTGTGSAMAPEASPVPSSGAEALSTNGTNERTAASSGSGQSEAATQAVGSGAATGDTTAGLKKKSRFTTISIPGRPGESYKAELVLKDLGDSNASHNGLTFEENPNFGLGKQQRDYRKAVNQRKIIAWSSEAEFNPDFHVQPSVDPINGPPIEDTQKNVLSGNGRHQTQERVYAAGGRAAQRLRDAIAQRAAEVEGLDPQQAYTMKRPSLRLVISDEELAKYGPEARQNLIADANEPGTAALTEGERMMSDSRRVSDSTVNHVGGLLEAIGPEATLSQALDGSAGPAVLERLVNDGVVRPQAVGALVKSTKAGDVLNDAGKERVTRLMVGRFFTDPEQLEKLPLVRNQIERVAAPLSQVDGLPEWSLTPHVQEAVEILEKAHDGDFKNLDDFFKQDGIFGTAKYSPEAVDLARALKSAPAEVIKGAARQYAGEAAEASRGASMFGDVSTPAESFKGAFSPEALEKRAAELKAARDAARKKTEPPANALAETAPAEPANALTPKPRKPRAKK